MTIAFVNSSTFTSSASAASFSPTMPASIVANNLLVAHCSVNATGKAIGVSAGWTLGPVTNTGNQSAAVAYKVAVGADPAPTFSWTGAAACSAFCVQWSGTLTVTPVGSTASNQGNATTTITLSPAATTANNSVIYTVLFASTSQTIPAPADYTNIGNNVNANGSDRMSYGFVGASGATPEAISVAISSADFTAIAIELVGSGAAATGNERISQSAQLVLESYTSATNVRSSQVSQMTLESYVSQTNVRASQVSIQVLRTVAAALPADMRKTLSRIGGRVGTRQTQGWGS